MSTPPSENKLCWYNHLMMMVIGFELTGLIGTAVGYYFQTRAEHRDHDDYHRHEDRATAKEITLTLKVQSRTTTRQLS